MLLKTISDILFGVVPNSKSKKGLRDDTRDINNNQLILLNSNIVVMIGNLRNSFVFFGLRLGSAI